MSSRLSGNGRILLPLEVVLAFFVDEQSVIRPHAYGHVSSPIMLAANTVQVTFICQCQIKLSTLLEYQIAIVLATIKDD